MYQNESIETYPGIEALTAVFQISARLLRSACSISRTPVSAGVGGVDYLQAARDDDGRAPSLRQHT